MNEILITHIKGLVQVRPSGLTFVAGKAMSLLPIIENAWLHLKNGLIHDFGIMDNVPKISHAEIIDASDRFVFPSFVDSHTHIVFAASREDEFVMKLRGASYAEIAAAGGGILNSAKKIHQISEDALFEKSLHRVKEIIKTGTGAVEIKSGYGLRLEDELKMLRVAKRIGAETDLTIKTTFLGAHAVPHGVTKPDYIKQVVEEMIPAVAENGLADYIDVFCEHNFFTPEETIQIAEEGKKYGMKPRIHANQLGISGGVQAGVHVGAISVDHLENIGAAEIESLQNTNVMPTALPGAAFFLNMNYTPARSIIDSGLPLAIASDYNPGSSPSGNMLLMMSLACIKMRMLPEEAFNAATINTAYALELQDSHGSITRGKIANVCISQPIPSLAFLPYSYGHSCIEQVILKGQSVSVV
jgi:imidazolonepropionase